MRISFDFDGTLEDEFGGATVNEQKEEIKDIARRYVISGHDVVIITKRYGPENSTMGLGNEHLVVNELASELGIQRVYFTNREMKFGYIYNLGIQAHFENSNNEIQLINQMCSEKNYDCVVVPVEDDNWRDIVYSPDTKII